MTRQLRITSIAIYLGAVTLAVGSTAGCGTGESRASGKSKAAAMMADWKFLKEVTPVAQPAGRLFYDLGDGFKATHLMTRKRGFTVWVGVPPSVYEQAKQSASGEEAIGRVIAWEAIKRACYPLHGELSRDYVGAERKGNSLRHMFRTAGGETATAVVEAENNTLAEGPTVRIWK